jgi:hypothetical protein
MLFLLEESSGFSKPPLFGVAPILGIAIPRRLTVFFFSAYAAGILRYILFSGTSGQVGPKSRLSHKKSQ